ncbi:hypothetical protein Tco_0205903 [Tanacetum coccineum]|uniref:Reverse transcriptase/retrotransposon-derived protein RNase H-like domain-containing protein n=1 Tax=Tanacetum coccineum TaxID=301880 RepID=A0ABQ5C1U1_9ASTR
MTELLLKEGQVLEGADKQEEDFQLLKQKVVQCTESLRLPEWKSEDSHRITCDASEKGFGRCVMQEKKRSNTKAIKIVGTPKILNGSGTTIAWILVTKLPKTSQGRSLINLQEVVPEGGVTRTWITVSINCDCAPEGNARDYSNSSRICCDACAFDFRKGLAFKPFAISRVLITIIAIYAASRPPHSKHFMSKVVVYLFVETEVVEAQNNRSRTTFKRPLRKSYRIKTKDLQAARDRQKR